MATFNLSSQVKIVNPVANIDSMYGPYGSTGDACNQTTGVPTSLRANGRTVGITTVNGVVEYWWKNGTADSNLVIKVDTTAPTLQQVVDTGNSWNNIRFVNSQESYFSVLNLASVSSEYLYYTDDTYSTNIGNTSIALGSMSVLTYSDGIGKLAAINTDSGLSLKTNSNPSSNAVGFIKTDNISAQVVLQFPTSSGTIALASDIPAALGYTPVDKAGDTMLGDLILNRDPEVALGAVTKQYVDNIAVGINFHAPVHVATTVNLASTYSNGVNGVGATLTATSFGALVVDSHPVEYLQRVLVWQQNDPKQNGIYDLTRVGDVDTYWQLTRSSDADNSPPGEINYGDFTFVQQGDTYGGFGFICNTSGTINIGTTSINYVQFNAAQVVTAGNGLQEVSTNVLEIDTDIVQEKITLGTTGSTGPATFINNVLNIPVIEVASSIKSGIVDNTSLQELGGVDKTINSVRIGRGNISDSVSENTAVGYKALSSVVHTTGDTGYFNTAFGDSALTALTTGYINSAFGDWALYTCTTGKFNTAVGTNALYLSNGDRNTALGSYALASNTGNYNTAVGSVAGGNTTSSGSSNILIGFQAGRDITTGSNNLLIENITNASITTGSYNIVLNPKQKAGVTTGSYNTLIGCWDGAFASGLTGTVAIGNGVGSIRFQSTSNGLTTVPGQTNALIDGDTTGKAVVTKEYLSTISGVAGSGTLSYLPKFTGTSSIGDSSIFDTGSTVSISGKLIINANGVYTVKSGWSIQTTGFGYNSLVNSTGDRNTAFGYNAASGSTSAGYNSAFGQYALFSNGITDDNTAIGSGALAWVNTGAGRNTAVGRNAGAGAGSSYNNIAESIFIGYLSRPGANSQTNQIVIGNDLAGAGSNTVTIGNNSITSTILKGLITAPLTTNTLIEADTTGKAVTTKEYVNNRLVVETTSGYTLTNADSGGIIIFKTKISQDVHF